jgi:hypothetical protein
MTDSNIPRKLSFTVSLVRDSTYDMPTYSPRLLDVYTAYTILYFFLLHIVMFLNLPPPALDATGERIILSDTSSQLAWCCICGRTIVNGPEGYRMCSNEECGHACCEKGGPIVFELDVGEKERAESDVSESMWGKVGVKSFSESGTDSVVRDSAWEREQCGEEGKRGVDDSEEMRKNVKINGKEDEDMDVGCRCVIL